MGQGTSASGPSSVAGSNEPADIDQILMLAARQHSQTAGNRVAAAHPSAVYGSTATPTDVTGHAAYQPAAPNQATLQGHALDSPHWGWTERPPGRAPVGQGQGQHQEQGRSYGSSDSGVAALLASLKGQVMAPHEQQGGHEHSALPSRVLDGQHRHASLQDGHQPEKQHAHQQHRAVKHQAAVQH